jgi:perosamine synthetase
MKTICLLEPDLTVFEAMRRMETAGARWACVITEERKILGVATHGDIRRYMLSGGSLDSSCILASNQQFFSLHSGVLDAELMSALAKYDFVPIVEPSTGALVDVATSRSLHSIPILEPNLGQLELARLNEVFLSGWISSKSPAVSNFEKGIEEYTGLSNCLAVSNGTVAIHLALEALGIEDGDEVIVPDLTFAATANAVLQAGAIPVFVDVEQDSLGLDLELLKKAVTDRTKAVILVHLYGFPARDYRQIHQFCKAAGLLLIEDCAEALGTYSEQLHVGVYGDAATFSFFGNKLVTTGEGGAVAFKDSQVAEKAKVLRDHGQSTERRYFHEVAGFNYRLTGLQAAIGIGQFERLADLLKSKHDVAQGYRRRLQGEPEIRWIDEKLEGESSHWLNVIRLKPFEDVNGSIVESVISNLAQEGIELRPVFFPLHSMPPYKEFRLFSSEAVPVSLQWHNSAVCLPSSTTLSDIDLTRVTDSIKNFLRNSRSRRGIE